METKICTKCGQELSIEDFNWRDNKKGTRRSECKYCHTKYMNNIYQTKRQVVVNLKSGKCCEKCGDKRDYVLDFHHKDPSIKEDTIARMISNNYRLEHTLKEIEKCIILCSNCHREFHYLEKENGITIDEYINNIGESYNGSTPASKADED